MLNSIRTGEGTDFNPPGEEVARFNPRPQRGFPYAAYPDCYRMPSECTERSARYLLVVGLAFTESNGDIIEIIQRGTGFLRVWTRN